MAYYLTALKLWSKAPAFDNQSRLEVLGMILTRRYRLHWLRSA